MWPAAAPGWEEGLPQFPEFLLERTTDSDAATALDSATAALEKQVPPAAEPEPEPEPAAAEGDGGDDEAAAAEARKAAERAKMLELTKTEKVGGAPPPVEKFEVPPAPNSREELNAALGNLFGRVVDTTSKVADAVEQISEEVKEALPEEPPAPVPEPEPEPEPELELPAFPAFSNPFAKAEPEPEAEPEPAAAAAEPPAFPAFPNPFAKTEGAEEAAPPKPKPKPKPEPRPKPRTMKVKAAAPKPPPQAGTAEVRAPGTGTVRVDPDAGSDDLEVLEANVARALKRVEAAEKNLNGGITKTFPFLAASAEKKLAKAKVRQPRAAGGKGRAAGRGGG